jgi:hypothetical protein
MGRPRSVYTHATKKRRIDDVHPKSEANFNQLAPEIWAVVIDHLDEDDALFFAMTCRNAYSIVTKLPRFNNIKFTVKIAVSSVPRMVEMLPKGLPWGRSLCETAASLGNLESLQWLRTFKCPWTKHVCNNAARHGHLHVLKWARKKGCSWDQEVCEQAAKGGHLDILQWARKHGCPWSFDTSFFAAMCGNVEIVKWLLENRCPKQYDLLIKGACVSGSVEILNLLRQFSGSKFPQRDDKWKFMSDTALYYGHLQILQWLHSNDYGPLYSNCIPEHSIKRKATANATFFIPIVQWYFAQNIDDIRSRANQQCLLAAKHGVLAVLRFILESGCYGKTGYTLAIPVMAARQGHLHILQWIHNQKLSWNSEDVAEAGAKYLHVVQWIIQIGKPWNPERVFRNAALSTYWKDEDLTTLEWMRTETEIEKWSLETLLSSEIILDLIEGRKLRVLKWMHDAGLLFLHNDYDSLYHAARNVYWNDNVIEWLENIRPASWEEENE